MKALVVHQPWASLLAAGIKTWETRPSPPAGPMRPDGAPPYPGSTLDPDEPVALVAGRRPHDGDLPMGAVIAVVRFVEAAPMEAPGVDRWVGLPTRFIIDPVPGPSDVLYVSSTSTMATVASLPRHEVVRGEWTPGRWAWRCRVVAELDSPVPAVGRQGVYVLPGTSVLPSSCPRCEARPVTTEHDGEELDWCPTCGWVDR